MPDLSFSSGQNLPNATLSRRDLLSATAASLVASLNPILHLGSLQAADKPRSPNAKPRIASIGMRYQGSVIAEKAQAHGDIVAICDVDREIAEKARG